MDDAPTTRPHSHRLRLGRHSLRSQVYFLTTVTSKRRPLFIEPTLATEIFSALKHYHDHRWIHGYAWVVMPDHIHWLVQLRVGTLPNLMRMFKTWSSTRIRKLLPDLPRTWQPGYHDHAVRHWEELEPYITYIVGNPMRAGLCHDPRDYPYLYGESEYLDIAGKEPELLEGTPPWKRKKR